MKKILFLLFLIPSISYAIPPLDRYGGHYDTQPDSNGIHYHYYIEPNANEFEYRAIMDDIYAIYKATVVSECSRLKVINVLLEKRVDPYLKYPPGVFRSSVPFDTNTLKDLCIEGHLFSYRTTFQMEILEALVIPPMVSTNSYAYTTKSDQGTLTFKVNISSASPYVLWAHVVSQNGMSDSFYVSIDGQDEDIFDANDGVFEPKWKWIVVNGRAKAQNPRIFNLTEGPHMITIRGREPYTYLHKIFLTQDLKLRL